MGYPLALFYYPCNPIVFQINILAKNRSRFGKLKRFRTNGFFWITIVLAALATRGFPLRFDTDYRAFDDLQNTYTKNDNVMFVLPPQDCLEGYCLGCQIFL